MSNLMAEHLGIDLCAVSASILIAVGRARAILAKGEAVNGDEMILHGREFLTFVTLTVHELPKIKDALDKVVINMSPADVRQLGLDFAAYLLNKPYLLEAPIDFIALSRELATFVDSRVESSDAEMAEFPKFIN